MSSEEKDYQDASLFDHLQESAYIVDRDNYQILYINQAGRRLLDMGPDEDCSGQHCYALLRGSHQPCMACSLQHSTDEPFDKEFYNEHFKKHFKVVDAAICYQGHKARLVMYVDITAATKQRHELETALQAEAVLNETVQILYAEPELDKALDLMLAHMGLYLQAERCLILNVEGGLMSCTHEWFRQGAESNKGQCQDLPVRDLERWEGTLLRHNNVLVPDSSLLAETYPEEYALLTRLKIENCVAAPILIRDHLAGIVVIANLPAKELDGASMMLLTLSYFIATSMVADQSRQLLEKASYSDIMTGVANRNAFIRDIESMQRSLDLQPVPVGVIYFDLNGLKAVNDQQGHRAGDRLIMRLADAISLFFRKQEIYRTGGDEFVILCLNMPEPQFEERLARVVDHIASVSALSVSVGYAWDEGSGASLQKIIAVADAKMYEEKKAYYKERRCSRD